MPKTDFEILIHGNIVVVNHRGIAKDTNASDKAAKLLQTTTALSKKYRRLAVVHNTQSLLKATKNYAEAFAMVEEKVTDNHLYILISSKSWIRILARVASRIAAVEIHIAKSVSEATMILQREGFSPTISFIS